VGRIPAGKQRWKKEGGTFHPENNFCLKVKKNHSSYLRAMDYFQKLTDLLKIECQEDRRSYLELARSSSLAERRAAGLAWYPIAIRDSEPGRGDYLTLEVERTTHLEVIHQLRSGAPAALISNHDPAVDRIEGTISFVGGHRLRITLPTDELPDWARNGKLGIDLLFDDNSYSEMFNALRQAEDLAPKKEEGKLVRVLIGQEEPGFHPHPDIGSPAEVATNATGLNPAQQSAVNNILAADQLAIVHGPPGTGKTTTLVQAILALLHRDYRPILVTAPSNTAVDLLSERLSAEGVNVLRIGNPARVSERQQSLTLDSRIADHPGAKEIRRLRKKAGEFRDMAHKYKRNFGPAEREQRKALFDEARNLMKDVERIEQDILDDLFAKARVITATLVGASHPTLRNLHFETAVIDEAGQALEPGCWIPVLRARRLVLAGDPFQLPPTVKSGSAASGGLALTLLEKAILLHPEAVTLLDEQYRMHEQIMSYPSHAFYADRLRAHSSIARRLLFAEDQPLLFIDTAGCGYEERREDAGISNPEEAAFLLQHAAGLLSTLDSHHGTGSFPSIGIISPYRQQVHLLNELLPHYPALRDHDAHITVNTIDSFQGQERDIIYIGMTRSNSDNRIGFLSEIRRMNVAMTRARKKLVVIGDSATLAQTPFYAAFIEFAERNDAWKSAWEFSTL
jgi:superfamily I DNA and/or RNA helicase